MAARVVLLRHGHTLVEPDRSPTSWHLSAAGRAVSERLCEEPALRDVTAIVTGGQPKMEQTVRSLAGALGIEPVADVRCRETDGEGWFAEDDFVALVHRFHLVPSSPPSPRWESASAAGTRFVAALRQLTAAAPRDGSTLVCSGGRVLTAALLELDVVDRRGAHATWRRLAMPDACLLELDAVGRAELVSPFGSTLRRVNASR